MKSIIARLVCFWLFLTVSAVAVPEGGEPPDAASPPGKCATSDDCAVPTPYCSPTLGVCVQCISTTNCLGLGLVCDQSTGVCGNCAADTDCYGGAAYCSRTLHSCVECLTDTNCGKQGIACKDGVCGTCGDGICSDKERGGFNGQLCEDCFPGCPKIDLKSKTGAKVASGNISAGADPIASQCGPGATVSVSFKFTPPSDGSYTFDAGPSTAVSLIQGTCAGQALMCWGGQGSVFLSKGQTVVILVGRYDGTAGPYTLGIQAVGPLACNPMFCPTGPSGEQPCCLTGDAGTCGLIGPMGCVPYGVLPTGSGGFPIFGSGGFAGFPNSSGGSRPIGGSGGVPNISVGGSSEEVDAAILVPGRKPVIASDSGCGCTVPRGGTPSGAALAFVAGVMLLAGRRRQRRQN